MTGWTIISEERLSQWRQELRRDTLTWLLPGAFFLLRALHDPDMSFGRVVSGVCFVGWLAFGLWGPDPRSFSTKLVEQYRERRRALVKVQFEEGGADLGTDEGALFVDESGALRFHGLQSEFLIARSHSRQVPEFEGAGGSWCYDWSGEQRTVRIRIWSLSRVFLPINEDPEVHSAGKRFETLIYAWGLERSDISEIPPPAGRKPTVALGDRLKMLFASLLPRRSAA